MPERITIDAGQKDSINAILNKPKEHSIKALDKTLVIMSHGFPGHKGHHNNIYADYEFILCDKGFHTLRFDYRGCGESDGREEDFNLGAACEDFQNIRFWAKTQGYEKFVYIGDGIGATLAIMNLDLDVKALVLLWPVLDLKTYKQSLMQTDDPKLAQGTYIDINKSRIGLSFLKELEKIDLTYAMKEIFAPTLIFHGARDKVVPIGQLDLARVLIRAKRIEITTFHHGDHGLGSLNQRKSMFFQVQQFLEKYV
jgi:pimeloyl-ACP methyl ester carboxylesterase